MQSFQHEDLNSSPHLKSTYPIGMLMEDSKITTRRELYRTITAMTNIDR